MAISNLPKLNFSVPFAMTAALPLEYNAYFSTLAEAQAAAQTAEAPGSTNTVYYFGQKIVVVTDSSADLYIIQPDKTLKEAGAIPVGDGKSPEPGSPLGPGKYAGPIPPTSAGVNPPGTPSHSLILLKYLSINS